jgi:hypothetical protein
MVDNVTADPGSGGATFKTDDDGTAHWPYTKMAFGADNTQTRVSTTDPMPVEARGAAAHDVGVSGNPLLNGGEARTTNPTAVGDGDAVRLMADTLGKLVVQLGAPIALQLNGKSTMADTAADDIIAAQGAGVKIAVMGCLVTNGSAANAADVSIRDGTTAKITGHCAINGGGFALSGGGFPLFISTANTAVTAISSAAADIDVFVWGYAVTN